MSKQLSRRDFIKKSLGAAGLVTVAASPLVLFNRVRAGEDSPPEATAHGTRRAWSMVIDLKKCEGCVTIDSPPQCTQACIAGHYIPKGQEWIQVFEVDMPGGGSYFMPTPCFHCEAAPCVNVCPVAATYHTDEGVVLIDQMRCIGCRFCMAACPYQRRFFNWGEPDIPPEALFAVYSPETQVPAIRGTVMKCDFCPDMLRKGSLPYCVTGCPMKALYMGDLSEDKATNGVDVVRLSTFLDQGNAYRYKAELGTQPRVWFLPGHGQDFGRLPDDKRPFQPPQWSWGGDGYDYKLDVFPWGKGK